MTENSAEMAGGTAHGLHFAVHRMHSSDLDSLAEIMTETAKRVKETSGTFLGHVKMSVDSREKGAMTLNLTDLDTGVERHGSISFPADSEVRFMAAVLDVEHEDLVRIMVTYLSGKGYKVSQGHVTNIIDIK